LETLWFDDRLGFKIGLIQQPFFDLATPLQRLIEIKPQLIVMRLTPHFYIVLIPSSSFLLGLSTFVRLILLA